MRSTRPSGGSLILLCLLVACGDDASPADAGPDARDTEDASSSDAGRDAGGDAGGVDAGPLPSCDAAGFEVCVDEGDRCEVAFEDGEGCAAVCAAIGRVCVDALDTPGLGCEHDGTSLGCAPTGHGSDRCVCDRAPSTMDAGVDAGTDAGTGDDVVVLSTRKAFPSAAGHHADGMQGGRGGALFFVDDLGSDASGRYDEATDTHTGTLRYALEHPDPGIVVFRVAGIIRTDGNLRLTRSGARKTVLGATAPAPGIVLYGGSFLIQTTGGDWVLRGVTVLGGSGLSAGRDDAFAVDNDVENMLLADNTFGFGADEAYTVRRMTHLIAQRNLAFEGHPEHNVGSIFAVEALEEGMRTISAHDNAYVHISHRFPNAQGLHDDRIEVVNQFAYNWNRRTESHKFMARHNDINNYYRRGPRTSSTPRKAWNAHNEYDSPFWDPPPAIHTSGNIMTGFFDDPDGDNRTLWSHHISSAGFVAGEPLGPEFFVDTPHPLGLDMHVRTAAAAFAYNIEGRRVGARWVVDASGERVAYRTPLASGYLDDAIAGTTDHFLDDQADFVPPTLPAAGAPYEDRDADGMADAWERAHGLVVGERDHEGVERDWVLDGTRFRNDAGYTNLEIFAEWAHGGFLLLADAAADR